MSHLNMRRLLVGSVCAASLLVTSQIALANVPDRVEHQTTVTPGSHEGRPGYWVDVSERVFRWVAAPSIPEDFRKAYITNHPYDGITHWGWQVGPGIYPDKGDRDWVMSELVSAFGDFGKKSGTVNYGQHGLEQTGSSQAARALGQAYRFLKIAEFLEQEGITSIPDPIAFSLLTDSGITAEYRTDGYKTSSNLLSTLPNLKRRFYANGNKSWEGVCLFTITDLTPELARAIARDLYTIAKSVP